MLAFIRRIFGPYPPRFSDDVRGVTGRSQSVAVACGATRINTAHLLAAVAKHPRGDEILAGRAMDIFAAVCGEKPASAPTPIPPNGVLEAEDEFKHVIQALAKNALAPPKHARSIELDDLVRVLSTMPDFARVRGATSLRPRVHRRCVFRITRRIDPSGFSSTLSAVGMPGGRLTFDRAIDAAGLNGTQITVGIEEFGYLYNATGTVVVIDPATIDILLVHIGGWEGGNYMHATSDNGIVAVDDGGTWPGVPDTGLPYP